MSGPSISSKLRLLAGLCDRLADTLRDVALVLRAEEQPAPLPPYLVDKSVTTTGPTVELTWYDSGTVGPQQE